MTASQHIAQAATLVIFGVVLWVLGSIAITAHLHGLARLRAHARRIGGTR